MPKESRRSEGKETLMPVPDRSAFSRRRTVSRFEWSVVESEVSDTSS